MKTISARSKTDSAAANSRCSAFTLAELMTATAIFSLVVLGALSCHLFGMRVFNICATRLSASQGSRRALNRVCEDIRSGKLLYIGNGNGAGFTNISKNNPRLGNALEIYPIAGSNAFVRYFMDSSAQALKRYDSTSGNVQTIAPFVTNAVAFSAEDYAGNVLTNDQNNRVIRLELDFYQWQFPAAQAGAYYDSYHLQTRIARRNIE